MMIAGAPLDGADTPEAKQQAMRAAGQQVFDQVLAKASKGQDPFLAMPPKGSIPVAADELDPDVKAFGELFEKNKSWVALGLFTFSNGIVWVLLKLTCSMMHTPGVLTFLHMLAAAGMLMFLSTCCSMEKPQLSMTSVRGASMQAVIYGMQTLCVTNALFYGTIMNIITFLAAAPLVIDTVVDSILLRRTPPTLLLLLSVAGAAGVVLELWADVQTHTGAPVMLALWAVMKGVDRLWQHLKVDATLGGRIDDADLSIKVREVAAAEEQLNPTTTALMQNALAALPVLLLALGSLEGVLLVEHEPNAPTLTLMLLSMLAFSGAAGLQVALKSSVAKEAWPLVRALSFVVTMCFDLWLEKHPTQVSERPELVLLGGATAVACAFYGGYLHWQHALGNADAYNILPRVWHRHPQRRLSPVPYATLLMMNRGDEQIAKHL